MATELFLWIATDEMGNFVVKERLPVKGQRERQGTGREIHMLD